MCDSQILQAKKLAIPAASALATHTRSAQLQDKVEQQQLKQLVLDYEQREEVEELKGTKDFVNCEPLMLIKKFLTTALESRNRHGAIKIRYVG